MSIKSVKAIINGVEHTLTLNSATGKYEATVTAPNVSSYKQAGHFYPVTIKATDAADNVTTVDSTDAALGSNLRLIVKEKVAPTITVNAPTTGSVITNSLPTITWDVLDNDSGINPATITLSVDGSLVPADGISKTETAQGYICAYTPATALSDGSHALVFNVSDNDGNAATAVVTNFKIDTVPPTLSITSPDEGFITNATALTVTGTTNDDTSSPVTVTVNGIEATVDADGNFSVVVPCEDVTGTFTLTVIATDAAGKSTIVTRNGTIDRLAPVISAVSLTPNPVDAGATYIISVTVTD